MSTDSSTPEPSRRPPAAGAPPAEPPDDVQAEEEPPGPDSYRILYHDPGIRNYLFTGLAALAMLFVVLFGQGSDVGGVLVVLVGLAGLVLRRPAAPPLLVLLLTYFLVFPYGVPDGLFWNPYQVEEDRFRIDHLLLVASAVVYLVCVYRVLGLTRQAIPFDTKFPKKSDEPTRRPAELILPGEVGRLFYLAAGVVLAGQVVWLLVTVLEPDPGEVIPLKFARRRVPGVRGAGGTSPVVTRLIVAAGLLFFGTVLARLVFGYWRLRVTGPAEGAMVLQDAGWEDTHRERVRVEKGRAWARKRAGESGGAAPPGGAR